MSIELKLYNMYICAFDIIFFIFIYTFTIDKNIVSAYFFRTSMCTYVALRYYIIYKYLSYKINYSNTV